MTDRIAKTIGVGGIIIGILMMLSVKITDYMKPRYSEVDRIIQEQRERIKTRVAAKKPVQRKTYTKTRQTEKISSNFCHQFDGEIRRNAKMHDLDHDLVRAVIKQESGCNPNALSEKGAIGLMQVLPIAARDVGMRSKNLWDPDDNMMAGTAYLAKWLKEFDSKEKALFYYYNGPGNAEWMLKTQRPEEHFYVRSVMAHYKNIKKPYSMK